MALTNPYCTVAQVQKELRNTDSAIQTQLEECIGQASRWIDDYMRRDYLFHDYSATPLVIDKWSDAVYGDALHLPYFPVITLTAVSVEGEAWVENTDYVIRGSRLMALDGTWSVGVPPDNTIELTGTFGYTQSTSADVPTGIPDHITRAAILAAAAFSGHNQKELVTPDGFKQTVVDKAIPKTVFDLLGPRRKIKL